MAQLTDPTNLKCGVKALAVKLQDTRLKKHLKKNKTQHILNCFTLFLLQRKKEFSHNRAFAWPLKESSHRHSGYLTQYIHSPGKFNEVYTVSHLMVKTIDGKNDLWPSHKVVAWTALPHRCFIWLAQHPKYNLAF